MKQACSHAWRDWRKAPREDRRIRTCRNCGTKQFLDVEFARPVDPPKRAWCWPDRIATVGAVLAATQAGFELVTTHTGRYHDRPIYALRRDGEISPQDRLLQGAARGAAQRYFEHDRTLEDGTIVYKRRPPS